MLYHAQWWILVLLHQRWQLHVHVEHRRDMTLPVLWKESPGLLYSHIQGAIWFDFRLSVLVMQRISAKHYRSAKSYSILEQPVHTWYCYLLILKLAGCFDCTSSHFWKSRLLSCISSISVSEGWVIYLKVSLYSFFFFSGIAAVWFRKDTFYLILVN